MSSTPGLLLVTAHFTSEAITPETFSKWYNTIHIPHLLTMSGISTALRYEKLPFPSAPSAEPYLAIYPLRDIAFVQSEEMTHAADSCESEDLPGRSVFKTVEFRIETYEFMGDKASKRHELRHDNGESHEKVLGTGAPHQEDKRKYQGTAEKLAVLEFISPAPTTSDELLISYFQTTYIPLLKTHVSSHHTRSKLFRLVNESPINESEEVKKPTQPQRWLTMHEFGQVDEVDGDEEASIFDRSEEGWKKLQEKLMGHVGGKVEKVGYRLTESFGKGTWIV